MKVASVSGISLDSRETARGTAYAFVLNKPASQSRRWRSSDDWDVELRAGSACVIARTADEEQAQSGPLDRAIQAANEALDLAAVLDGDVLLTKRAAEEFILFENNTCGRMTIQCLLDFPVAVGPVEMVVTRADGTVERPVDHIPEWVPAFRFFRLSQASSDLFEAYRNLFLALEALLDQLFPKRRDEGEKQWLIRSFRNLSESIDLREFELEPTSDPAGNLVDWFYGVRVRLFHAKEGRSFIPEARVGYGAVSVAYGPLAHLWRRIADAALQTRVRGGVLTNVGFRMMVENAFKETFVAMTADVTPVQRDQTEFSPMGLSVARFASAATLSEIRPGRIEIRSQMDLGPSGVGPIGRLGLVTAAGHPMVTGDDFGLIDTTGVDHLRVRYVTRLINTKLPRVEF